MKAKEISQSLESLIEAQIPVFVWGSPGIGKSSIVKQIAEDKNKRGMRRRWELT